MITTLTFYDWCVDNNRNDVLDRWDYELNKVSPEKVSCSTHNKYWFKCPLGIHKSELKLLKNFTYCHQEGSVKCRACNSFAQYGIDNISNKFLDLYWDYSKNTIDPWVIDKGSTKKVWIICQNKEYHKSYEISCHNFYEGKRCPYCSSTEVHPIDSFLQYHINHTDKDFLKKYWGISNDIDPQSISFRSTKKIYINCQNAKYHGEYLTSADRFTNGNRCPYCNPHTEDIKIEDSLGYLFKNSIKVWGNNDITPFNITPRSHRVVSWKCQNKIHPDYKRCISSSVNSEFRCPICVSKQNSSILETKVTEYIQNNYNFKIYHEYECTLIPQNPKVKCKTGRLPFDNEIIIGEKHLIIEVNGEQHYGIAAYSTLFKRPDISPEEQLHKRRVYDRYKKYVAIHNGYDYLEIPYWTIQDGTYKEIIDNKISIIKQYEIGA